MLHFGETEELVCLFNCLRVIEIVAGVQNERQKLAICPNAYIFARINQRHKTIVALVLFFASAASVMHYRLAISSQAQLFCDEREILNDRFSR